MITFVVASHNKDTFNNNIGISKIYKEGKYKFIVIEGFDKCTRAYNSVLDQIKTPYVAYLHHDIIMFDNFETQLITAINNLNFIDPTWGVAGMAGVTKEGGFIGCCLSYGAPWGSFRLLPNDRPYEINVLDELFLLKKNDGYLFDENISYNHMYGSDLCLHYRNNNQKSYVIPALVNHNASFERNPNEGNELSLAAKYIGDKYPQYVPFTTTCLRVEYSHVTNDSIS